MSWWHYLLLVNFYLVLFFGFYALLLRRETFFQLNRIYLVSASLLSFFIPLIQAEWVKNLFITREVQYSIYSNPVVMVYNLKPAESPVTMGGVLSAIYIGVTLFLLLRLLWQLVVLKKAIEKPSPSAAYSFFKKISLGEEQSRSKIIVEHEQVHARQWHSVDVLIIETVMIINWFNPVVYLYRFAIQYIHEFIADMQVIQSGTDKADYAILLLSQTFAVPPHRLVNPFYNHSLLKKRILMLQKSRSQRIALAKYGLSAPLFILMMIFSSATINNSKAVSAIKQKTAKVFLTPAADAINGIVDHAELLDEYVTKEKNTNISNKIIDTVKRTDSKVFTLVEKQPTFPGGINNFFRFLQRALRYPAVDKENNITGKVILQFVVEKDGSLADIKGVRGPSATLIDEAERVMAASPKWEPGYQNGRPVRVAYTMPISFVLSTPPTAIASQPELDKSRTLPAANDTTVSKNIIFSQVESQPQFAGGVDQFMQFLAKNIRYPAAMRNNNIQGKVIAQFIIEKDGTLSNIKAIRELGYGSAEEAIRVLALSPKWQPGYQNGQAVRVVYTVPITFALSNENTPIYGSISDDADNNANRLAFINVANQDTYNTNGANRPLFVVDGIVKDPARYLYINAQDIAGINVLKGVAALKYGESAQKSGVVVVTTKGIQKAANLTYAKANLLDQGR